MASGPMMLLIFASDRKSEMGQKLTSRPKNATSALPLKADIVCRTGHVRKVPIASDASAIAKLPQAEHHAAK
jgi:hypothetical protein